ncbi:MAG: hypothetical protein ACFFAX_02655 [Promethearchaeota archaeon]
MNRSFLAKTIIRMIAILIVPLALNIDFGVPISFQYVSLIFSFGMYPYYDYYMQPPFFSPISFDFLTIGLAFAVCFPGIYFTRWLTQQPREKAIKKMALAAAVFISLIVYPLSILVPYGGPYVPMPYYVGSMIQSIVPWVIAVFVVLPVLGRQGSYIDSDRKAAYFSQTPESLIHEGGIRPGRFGILSYILGIIALCFPSIAYFYSYFSPYETGLNFGMITAIWIGYYSSGFGYGYFSFYIMPAFGVILTYLMNIFSLVFAYSVLQYIQTHTEKTRVLAYAALSIIAPAAFFMIISPFMTAFPIPVLIVLGFLVVFLQKQVPPRQTIWEDRAVQMWFEKDPEIVVMGNPPSGKQAIHSEAHVTVRVPFTYLILSKLRSLRSPNIKSAPDTKSSLKSPKMESSSEISTSSESDPHKADWAKSDDLWVTDEG